jgi:AsmA protein
MNKVLKYVLLGLGGLAGVVLAVISYVILTFNPADYKDKVIQLVHEKYQRTLHLDGDIKLSIFPTPGVSLNKVALSERNSEQEFAALDALRVKLALWPLLRKQVVVDEMDIHGMRANLVKLREGKLNVDDMLGTSRPEGQQSPAAASQAVSFDVAAIAIHDAHLGYRDEVSGAQYTIKGMTLKTGRVASGVPVKVGLHAGIQSSQLKLDVTTDLKTTLTFDLQKQQYHLSTLDFKLEGAAMEMSNLQVQVSGDVDASLMTGEYGAQKLAVDVSGARAKDRFTAKLEVPVLNLADDKFAGDKLILHANLKGAPTDMEATLEIAGLSGNAQAFMASNMNLQAQIKQPDQTIKINTSAQLSGNFRAQQFDLNNIRVAMQGTGDKLPNKAVSSEVLGTMQLNMAKQIVRANFAGGLLGSQIKAKVGVENFSKPAVQFDIALDQLDVDRYLPPKPAPTNENKATDSESSLDLSALRTLNLDGNLSIGVLKVMNVKSNELNAAIKASNGVLGVNPLSMNLYQGSLNGSLSVNAQAAPTIAISQILNGVNVAALGKDVVGFDTLEGRGDVALNLNMHGNTVTEMKKSLAGQASLNLADGAIKGINIAKKIRDARNLLGAQGQSQSVSANQEEKTDFSELRASFKVENGIAHNDDLAMKSPLLRLSGNGDINIGNDSINYLAKATLAKTLEGQGGKDAVAGLTVPVRVSGPYTDLKYTLDFAAMVSEEAKLKVTAAKEAVKQQAKEKIEQKKEEIKTQIQDQIRDKLKGLFR